MIEEDQSDLPNGFLKGHLHSLDQEREREEGHTDFIENRLIHDKRNGSMEPSSVFHSINDYCSE